MNRVPTLLLVVIVAFLLLTLCRPGLADPQNDNKTTECYSNPSKECVFAMAVQVADDVSDLETRIAAFGRIAQAQALSDNLEASSTIIYRLIKDARERYSYYSKAKSLAAIAILQVKLGFQTDAFNTLKEAIENAENINQVVNAFSVRIAAFADIAVARAQIDDLSTARVELKKLANTAKRKRYIGIERTQSFVVIGVALANIGDISAARSTLKEEYLRVVNGHPWHYALALLGIGEIEAIAGNLNTAQATYLRASQVVKSLRPHYKGEHFLYDEVLARIAVAQAKVGQISAARETARKITDSYNERAVMEEISKSEAEARDQLTIKAVKAAATEGNVIKALNATSTITNPISRVEALKAIAVVLGNRG